MELNEYQKQAVVSAVYPDSGKIGGLVYTVLGLTGEAGELANKLKKHLRNGTQPDAEVLQDELGDVMWYCCAVAQELGYNLDDVARFNLKKLHQRVAEGTVKNR